MESARLICLQRSRRICWKGKGLLCKGDAWFFGALQLCLLSPYWGAATRPGNQPTQRRPRIWKRKRARDEMGPPNQLQKVENLRWKLEQTPGPNLGSDLAVSSFGHANNTHYNTHVSQAYITNHHHKEIMNSSSNIEFPSKKNETTNGLPPCVFSWATKQSGPSKTTLTKFVNGPPQYDLLLFPSCPVKTPIYKA